MCLKPNQIDDLADDEEAKSVQIKKSWIFEIEVTYKRHFACPSPVKCHLIAHTVASLLSTQMLKRLKTKHFSIDRVKGDFVCVCVCVDLFLTCLTLTEWKEKLFDIRIRSMVLLVLSSPPSLLNFKNGTNQILTNKSDFFFYFSTICLHFPIGCDSRLKSSV